MENGNIATEIIKLNVPKRFWEKQEVDSTAAMRNLARSVNTGFEKGSEHVGGASFATCGRTALVGRPKQSRTHIRAM